MEKYLPGPIPSPGGIAMYIFGNQSFSRILECEISIRNVIMLDQDIINVI